MIIVTVELAPGGDQSRKRHLGTAVIALDARSLVTPAVGNYSVMLSKWGRPREAWRTGRVEGFPRKRLGPWDLLCRALNVTVGDRNG